MKKILALLIFVSFAAQAQINYTTVSPVPGDDWPNLQAKINYCIKYKIKNLYFKKGIYEISQPLLVENNGQFVSLNLLGSEAAHFTGSEDTEAKIVANFTSGFAIGYQLARSSLIRGLVIYGQGRGMDTRFDVYSGIAIDPYNRGTTSGSSGILIKDCRIRQFTNGVTISQNGVTLNAENIHLEKCSISDVRNAYATCQRQEKQNTVRDLICWDNVETVFNGMDYGQGLGVIPQIYGANIAGSVYQIFNFQYQDHATFAQGIFAENLTRIGTIIDAGVGVTIRDSHFEFSPWKFPQWHFKGNGITFDNCVMRYYDGLNNKRIIIDGLNNTFTNGYTDLPFLVKNTGWEEHGRMSFYSNYKVIAGSKTRVVTTQEIETFYWLDQQLIDVENKRIVVNRYHNGKVGDYIDGGHPFNIIARVAAVNGDTLFLDCIQDGWTTKVFHIGLTGFK
jgi:hypothetical protein